MTILLNLHAFDAITHEPDNQQYASIRHINYEVYTLFTKTNVKFIMYTVAFMALTEGNHQLVNEVG